MTSFLFSREVRIFDYPKFAEPFRERIRENPKGMAAAAGIEIEFIRTRSIRKEDRAQELLAKWGEHPGLVCIFSAMEPCSTYKPWHNKQSGKTYFVPNDGKCLHYYFYFVDEELGFCHVRVPTWLPCRLQICLNGHNWQRAQAISHGWEANPRTFKRVGAAVLSGLSRFRHRLPLERESMRVRHRCRLP